MSANTSITEGGKARPFGPVKVLMVQGSDGKYYPWFPESDRALGTLSVDKNGVYKASDKGVYGWSRVSVNVPQNEGVTGRDPDTGEDVYVHPDPSGELVKDVLPVEIRVIEPPTNPYGTYVDGQTITKDGMVVKAYLATGGEYGTVHNNEITLNPTTAVYDASTDTGAAGGTSSYNGESLSYISATEFTAGQFPGTSYILTQYSVNGGSDVRCYRLPRSETITIVISKTPFSMQLSMTDRQGNTYTTTYRGSNSSTTTNGTTFYYSSWAPTLVDSYGYFAPSAPMADKNYNYEEAATILYDGETETTPAGSPQTITVSWPRPGDGAILETTFDINVGPHGGTGDD